MQIAWYKLLRSEIAISELNRAVIETTQLKMQVRTLLLKLKANQSSQKVPVGAPRSLTEMQNPGSKLFSRSLMWAQEVKFLLYLGSGIVRRSPRVWGEHRMQQRDNWTGNCEIANHVWVIPFSRKEDLVRKANWVLSLARNSNRFHSREACSDAAMAAAALEISFNLLLMLLLSMKILKCTQ